MSYSTQAMVVLVTWSVLMALYAVNRYGCQIRFSRNPIVVDLVTPAPRAGTFLSRTGTLVVFLANIATLGLLLFSWLFPVWGGALGILRIVLPISVQAVGGALFVLCTCVGLLVLLYNANYTPLYRDLRGRYVITTEGPYRRVRHPRYAAEAALIIALFLFTGFWTPLLGLLAWPAMYFQALAEEELLLSLAPEAYGAYRQRTGMFFLKLR